MPLRLNMVRDFRNRRSVLKRGSMWFYIVNGNSFTEQIFISIHYETRHCSRPENSAMYKTDKVLVGRDGQ